MDTFSTCSQSPPTPTPVPVKVQKPTSVERNPRGVEKTWTGGDGGTYLGLAFTHDVKDQNSNQLKPGDKVIDVHEEVDWKSKVTCDHDDYVPEFSGHVSGKFTTLSKEGQFEDKLGYTGELTARKYDVAHVRKHGESLPAGTIVTITLIHSNHTYQLDLKDGSPLIKLPDSFEKTVTIEMQKQADRVWIKKSVK